jgi:type IV pilus assembly protein PilC
MLAVAEETGSLPEVLLTLADHYENLVELKRNFIGQITMPILQLIASIFIISAVIYVIGMIGSTFDGKPIDVLGWGLTGTAGAATFFFGSFGSMLAVYLVYYVLSQVMKQGYRMHALFLMIPVLGPCLRSFAIARFAWSFALTQQAGMRIVPSLEASLKATANQAFIAATPRMSALINQGEDFSIVLQDSRLFTKELEEMVEVAETSGTVPEMLEHMSPRFEDQARRSLANLATALGWLVWALVAGFIIFAIFSLANFYFSMLKSIN